MQINKETSCKKKSVILFADDNDVVLDVGEKLLQKLRSAVAGKVGSGGDCLKAILWQPRHLATTSHVGFGTGLILLLTIFWDTQLYFMEICVYFLTVY